MRHLKPLRQQSRRANIARDIYSIVGELPRLEGRLGDRVQEEVDGGVHLVPGHLGGVQQILAALI